MLYLYLSINQSIYLSLLSMCVSHLFPANSYLFPLLLPLIFSFLFSPPLEKFLYPPYKLSFLFPFSFYYFPPFSFISYSLTYIASSSIFALHNLLLFHIILSPLLPLSFPFSSLLPPPAHLPLPAHALSAVFAINSHWLLITEIA